MTILYSEINRLIEHITQLKDLLIIEILFLVAIIWVAGKLFRKLDLPAVIGELTAGIILGPPILGLISFTPSMKVLAELGSFFLMFFAGLETDLKLLQKNLLTSFLTALFGAVIPFVAGFYISYYYFGNQFYALFVALTMSATAIAVTDRLLEGLQLPSKDFKTAIMGAAVITDLIVLSVFSFILYYSQTGKLQIFPLLIHLLKILIFIGFIVYVGLILYPKYAPKFLTPQADGFTFAILIAFIIGTIAEVLGLHFVFGAFMAGLFSHEELTGRNIYVKTTDRMYAIAHGFLGPVFFLGLASYFSFPQLWKILPFFLFVVFIAVLTKVIGAALGAYFSGSPFRCSISYGCGMNGRATIALIIGSVGLKEGIISEQIFSLIIALAIVSTIMTPFLLKKSLKNIN